MEVLVSIAEKSMLMFVLHIWPMNLSYIKLLWNVNMCKNKIRQRHNPNFHGHHATTKRKKVSFEGAATTNVSGRCIPGQTSRWLKISSQEGLTTLHFTKPWSTSLKEAMVREEDGAADFCGCAVAKHLYIPKRKQGSECLLTCL
ncbi:hypothetical protein Ocin01_14328 [Orchesella cincta]|uniref:Uncharacterized protein n=1 Tax=Orchesella cincta TaxID=48709 RepID=A0A1D2MHP4_ORCCI|nr:hypothetical protein Ocin01_14328 [Orchesella cincta]